MRGFYANAFRVLLGRYQDDFAWRESQEERESDQSETDSDQDDEAPKEDE